MTNFDSGAVAIQILSCAFMSGVIAVIQLIHYPCFSQIDSNQFSNFHLRHTKALGLIAGPIMVLELISAIWLVRNGSILFIINLLAVMALWILTFSISIPSHNKLAKGFNEQAWKRLLRTNWPRTILWWTRSIAFLICLCVMLRTST